MNIGNPSPDRARRQLEWFAERDEDILVLTETAPSRGCDLLEERFLKTGWVVRYPRVGAGERGVMIASRVELLQERVGGLTSYLSARSESAAVRGAGLNVIAVYVPSRDESRIKVERKRRFVDELGRAASGIAARSVLIGDLNILEPGHRPHHAWFQAWEYELYRDLVAAGWVDAYRRTHPTEMDHSWVGYEGNGYRFDHAFVSADVADYLISCSYLHETRETSLTDHSALTLELQIAGREPRELHKALLSDQASLF